ncbi:transposase family protein [Paenibacillus sp. BR2-3]
MELKQLDIYVKARKRAIFACSHCGAEGQPVLGIAAKDRTWRHLNFFEYPCYFHAELPKTHCGQCKRIMRVHVPWH